MNDRDIARLATAAEQVVYLAGGIAPAELTEAERLSFRRRLSDAAGDIVTDILQRRGDDLAFGGAS
ncbi:hypothetical protein LBMAG42_57630 [Deltaproteobacteria bacterium]|nr:hypothetical protein LBMAG42_57630 [Deltaproteobacteria bacterium]